MMALHMVHIASLLVMLILAPPAYSAQKSLFHRLGGKKKVTVIVSDFVDTIAGDSRLTNNPGIKAAAEKVDRKELKSQLFERICAKSGGPCKKETGKIPVLEKAQIDIRLKPVEWLFLVEDVNNVMAKHKIPQAQQHEILTLIMESR